MKKESIYKPSFVIDSHSSYLNIAK